MQESHRTTDSRRQSLPETQNYDPASTAVNEHDMQSDSQHVSWSNGRTGPNGADDFQYANTTNLQDGSALTDIDFNLMWPDSEDLFNSIFSFDVSNSWQLPPGTLPLPSDQPSQVGAGMLPPSSIGAYPNAVQSEHIRLDENQVRSNDSNVRSGDNQGAIHGVSQMVSNLSSSLTSAVESKSITSVFLDECKCS